MNGRLFRSTRGRVGIITLVTFSVVGLIMFAVLDFTGVIGSYQDVRDNSLLTAEDSRIAQEIQESGSVEPRTGKVRTIIVNADRVVGLDPLNYEEYADSLPVGTDLSPEGLDPAVFDSSIVFFPILEQRGWHAYDGFGDDFEPIPYNGVVVLSAVVDHSMIGPLSVSTVLLLAIPVGSVLLAGLFAAVAGTGLRPVRRMTQEAAEIQIGDLEGRLPDPGTGDELSDLSATINSMLDRVSNGVATERRFVADAAHELRSPIAASTSLLEVALSTGDLDWTTTASSVLDEQRRLGALVDDLVLLARLDDAGKQAHPEESISFDDIVVAETSRPFSNNIEVITIEPVEINADPRSIVRLVRNLLSNADRHAAGRIEVRLETKDGFARLHIDDDGPGVPVDQRTYVFDRFARLDAARTRDAGGSGIGLAIVKQVAELNNGTAIVTDSPLGGARFTVAMPIAASASSDEGGLSS